MPHAVWIRETDKSREERVGLMKMGSQRMEYKMDYKRGLKGKIKERNRGRGNEKEALKRSVKRVKLETGFQEYRESYESLAEYLTICISISSS